MNYKILIILTLCIGISFCNDDWEDSVKKMFNEERIPGIIRGEITYLIEGQENITVYFVDEAWNFCGSSAIGCATMDGTRKAYIEYYWGNTPGLISHEVTHIAMNEREHTDKFFETALRLNQPYGECAWTSSPS